MNSDATVDGRVIFSYTPCFPSGDDRFAAAAYRPVADGRARRRLPYDRDGASHAG